MARLGSSRSSSEPNSPPWLAPGRRFNVAGTLERMIRATSDARSGRCPASSGG